MASAGSYHKLPEPDDLLECPYDKAHVIRFKKLPYHLLKCRQNHAVTYESCPFDARHQVPRPELSFHIETCPQRALVERDIAHALQHQDGWQDSTSKVETNVPPYDAWQPPEPEEDWGADFEPEGAASRVTWTAPIRDRQWLAADRGYAEDNTLHTDMQQLNVSGQQQWAAHLKKEHTVQPATQQQQGSRQPSLKGLHQQQLWQQTAPPAGPQRQQPGLSPPSVQQQQPWQPSPGLHTTQEPWQMSPGKQQPLQWQSDFRQQPLMYQQPANLQHPALPQPPRPSSMQQQLRSPLTSSPMQQPSDPAILSASAWQKPLQERKLPGSGAAQMLPPTLQPTVQVGRGRGTRPLPIVGSAANLLSRDMVVKETINPDPGRSRIAANFQRVGGSNLEPSGSHARELKPSASESFDVSEATPDVAAQFSLLAADSGDGPDAGDPIAQLQLKLKKIVKKLRQISDLEKRDHLDDDQKRKLSEKAELERERDTITKELKQLE